MLEQVERFVFVESVGGEHGALRWPDRSGDDGLESVITQPGSDFFERIGGEGRSAGERNEIREIVSPPPTSSSNASRIGGQCVHPHGSPTIRARVGAIRSASCCWS